MTNIPKFTTNRQIALYLRSVFHKEYIYVNLLLADKWIINYNNITEKAAEELEQFIFSVHNHLPSSTEYYWMAQALDYLIDESIDDPNYTIDIHDRFELMYSNDIVNAITLLNVDIWEPSYDILSIADIVNYSYNRHMIKLVEQFYALIKTIQV